MLHKNVSMGVHDVSNQTALIVISLQSKTQITLCEWAIRCRLGVWGGKARHKTVMKRLKQWVASARSPAGACHPMERALEWWVAWPCYASRANELPRNRLKRPLQKYWIKTISKLLSYFYGCVQVNEIKIQCDPISYFWRNVLCNRAFNFSEHEFRDTKRNRFGGNGRFVIKYSYVTGSKV